jgi:hypothetical protein
MEGNGKERRFFTVVGLFLVMCTLLPVASTGTCEFVENYFYTYDEVLQCFHSIPLTNEVKTQTLETMKRSLEIYAFYDIAHDSPSPELPLQVNMQQGLQQIYDRPYYYDFDFQEDLRDLYIAVSFLKKLHFESL